jgi:hypothetical protein
MLWKAAALSAFMFTVNMASAAEPDAGHTAGDWILAGGDNPGDWQFAMGPVGSSDMVLKFVHDGPGGRIIFDCTKAGAEELGFTVPVEIAPPGDTGSTLNIHLVVAGLGHDLPMKKEAASGNGVVAFTASGKAVHSVLGAMGAAGGGGITAMIQFTDQGGRKLLEALLPLQREIPATAGRVCQGWSDLKAAALSPVTPPSPAAERPQAAVQPQDATRITLPDGH